MTRPNPELAKQASLDDRGKKPLVGGGDIPRHEPQTPRPETDEKLAIKGDAAPEIKR